MRKFLAAVSGGPDSMALLDKYKKQIVAVCHVNYNIRQTAKRDYLIVKRYCLKNKIKLFIKDVNKETYSQYHSNNFENVARQIRYEFFLEVSKKTKINTILIGHNLDDFVETAYMQFKRKSKSLYYGIKKKSNYKELKIERPLLHIRKKSLEQYCIDNSVSFGIDETNLSDEHERNKVRKIISK